ncbi:hypothetical protein PACTADRAFT_51056 [Pachysolen tannophilus NRRL Y-2460]|uniref:Large ribosomal subunit protein bL28m n=1 Tax=Pachysolen tannophilus NRRL Y-2460 TaxID=669874 RepID=A0A1E4TR18_PACTA|nr:hypothetical protein PACTADRAFT_51056 [Pachysolen tannophilus NRRL Y-2460]
MNRFTNLVRSFSTTSSSWARQYKFVTQRRVAKQPELKIGDVKPWNVRIPKKIPEYPDYKYGESHYYKQSNKGLYGGQFLQFGNKISEFKNKSRRKWSPNVISKSLWSETLGKAVELKITARVLRTINKEGGLDNYITKEKSARVKELGPTGWKLKFDILSTRNKALLPKKHLHKIRDSENNLVTIFNKVTIGDKVYRFKVGKRALVRELFPLLQQDHIEKLSWKDYNEEYKNKSIEDITNRLAEKGFDFSNIII